MAFTSVVLTLSERDGYIDLSWVTTDSASVPDDRWVITRDSGTVATLYDVNAVRYRDTDVENNTAYSYVATGENDSVASAAVVGVPNPRAYGLVNPLVATIRYTTLADVKTDVNINTLDDTYDTLLTQAIVATELAIDQHLGRSFPDPSAGEIEGIPEAVKQVALSASIAVYNNTLMPAGTA